MIEIFGSQAPNGNNPALLAHGISVRCTTRRSG